MKLKIITSTQALDASISLDELVNEFCKNHAILDLDFKVDDGEIYIFITYSDDLHMENNTDYCNSNEVFNDIDISNNI